MSAASATITNSLDGKTLTFNDTGSYGTIISRSLQVNDFNGNPLSTINMGLTLTTPYGITADQWIQFVLTVVDNTGTFTVTKNYLAEGIYTALFLNIMKQLGCSCNCSQEAFENLFIGEIFLMTAERFAIGSAPISAENNIVAANLYINS